MTYWAITNAARQTVGGFSCSVVTVFVTPSVLRGSSPHMPARTPCIPRTPNSNKSRINKSRPRCHASVGATKKRAGDRTSACKSSFWRRSRGDRCCFDDERQSTSTQSRREVGCMSASDGLRLLLRQLHADGAAVACRAFRLRRSSLWSTTGPVPY